MRPDIAERAIGHAVGGTLGLVYDTHEYRAEKLAALQAWGAHVTAAVEGQVAENVVRSGLRWRRRHDGPHGLHAARDWGRARGV